MKWVFFIFILCLMSLAFAGTNALAQNPTRQYTPNDSVEDIINDINSEASETASPSPYVRYNDTNLAQPSPPQSSSVNTPTVASANGIAGFLANRAPSRGDRAGISKYLSIVQPETYTVDRPVGVANFGIAAWFSKEVSSNGCFEKRVKDFYTRVGRATAGINVDSTGLSRDVRGESGGRLGPGWLWNLAQKSADGDNGLALMLIGVCGHDDEAQGGADNTFTFRDNSSDAKRVIDYKLARYAEVRADLQSQIHRPSVRSQAMFASLDRETTKLRSAHAYTTISCPVRPNIFFSNQSLGTDADIDPDLKNQIQSTQNSGGTLDLPSKTYHIYDGAFLTCQMIEAGMSPIKARVAAAEAARIYRGLYLCQSMPTDQVDATPPGSNSPAEFLMKAPLERKCNNSTFKQTYAALCKLAPDALYYRENIRDRAKLKAKIDGMISSDDAAVLYKRWYFGGLTQKVGAHLACTDRQILGPSDLMQNETDGSDETGFNIHAVYKPSSWSNARYESAKRKLATWMVDSKWTIAQHAAGAKFAAHVCKPRSPRESIEEAACRIDAGLPGTPSAPARSTR